jgi:hypothetical protein
VSVLVRVQHHPARASLVAPLLARLPASTEVVVDPDPESPVRSPLRTYVEALRRPVPDDVTHVLVVQDDAWPVDDFEARMLDALDRIPPGLVAFFVPGTNAHGRAQRAAARRGQPYVRLVSTWVPTVALAWPVGRARSFVEFVAAKYDVERQRGDDAPVGVFRSRHRVDAWASVPSLVEHPDVVPSLIGRRNSAGRDRARVAAVLG